VDLGRASGVTRSGGAAASPACGDTLAPVWKTISLEMKRRSPRGGTPVKPASPGSGRRGSPLRAIVFVFVPPWVVCWRPFFSSRWLAAFAGGGERGRTTARPEFLALCGLRPLAASAHLVA